MKNCIVLNDTSYTLGHIGCCLVMEAIQLLCKKNELNILCTIKNPESESDIYDSFLKKTDCIIVNGEGTLHHDRPAAISIFKLLFKAKKYGVDVVLINTIWQENELLSPHLNIFTKIFVRESNSSEAVGSNYNCSIVPDLSLYTDMEKYVGITSKTNVPQGVAVFDSVTPKVSSFIYKNYSKREGHDMFVFNKLKFFYQSIGESKFKRFFDGTHELTTHDFRTLVNSRYIISGRFHGVCLSLLVKVPCVAFTSNTYKVEGILNDIFGQDVARNLLVNSDDFSVNDLNSSIEFVKKNRVYMLGRMAEYGADAISKIDEMFLYIKNA